jgi:hypothetical protein
MADPKESAPVATTQYQRIEDFYEAYANNVLLEQSVWDLKLIFGQLDQSGGKTATIQLHTAITLPWAQAKILSYWLRGHLDAYEITNGKIPIPSSIIPSELTAPSEEIKKSEPNAERIYALFNKLRNELVASL